MKLNILLLPKWYPTVNNPLDGIFIQQHAEAIQLYCNINVLFAEVDEFQKVFIRKEKAIENQVEVIRFFYKKHITHVEWIDRLIRLYLYFKCLNLGWKELSKTTTFHFLHAHVLLRTGIFALKIKQKHKISYFVSEHWTGYINGNLKGLKKILTKKVLQKSTTITCVSTPLQKGIRKLVNNDVQIIPNVVNTHLFTPKENNVSKNIILHISDLKDEHKNISGLIRSIAQLHKIRTDFELHIIGGGDEKNNLMAFANSLNLLDKVVFFLGPLKGEELVQNIQNCRFLTLFSNYETFGVVLIEALSCGKPVVASKLECIEEFITEKQGILVEPKNENQLAKAFDFMLDNYINYNPMELSEYAKNKFSFQTVGKQFYNLYQTILKK